MTKMLDLPLVSAQRSTLVLDGSQVTLEEVLAVAEGRRTVVLSSDAGFRERIAKGNAFLEQLLAEEGVI